MTDHQPSTSDGSSSHRPGPGHGAAGIGPGLVLAGLLTLIVVFGAGLAIGQGLVAGPSPTASPVAAATPTDTPSPTETPGTASQAPTSPPPATPSPVPSPAVSPSVTPLPASPSPTPAGPAATQPPDAPAQFGLFWEALRLASERFVDREAVTGQDLTYGAIRGMIEALGDAGHSTFLTPEELAAERDAQEGRVSGIGATLGERAGRAIIVSVISGAPADRAGLRSGDLILAVDGRSTDRLRSEEIVRLVRGEPGTEVTLTIQHRDDPEVIDVTIVRERIDVPAVTWAFVPGTAIADVRLISFSQDAGDAVKGALREILDEGAQQIILDLRSNPGGLVDEAVVVASQFLSDGVVYQRQDAAGTTVPVEARDDGIATELPLVVLVDEGTASSAEIVAGAIQDNGRGPVIGRKTFGTGTVLNTFELSDGSAVRIGVEHWLTPDGRLIFDTGIEPDEVVDLPAGGLTMEPSDIAASTPEEVAASSDSQLLRAIEILDPDFS